MRQRLLKELRCLLPAWALALVLPLAGWLAFGRLQHLFNGVLPFALVFSAFVGAAAFGTEFHHRTMPLLLSQPTSRRRLWHEKMLVLGAALASVATLYALTSGMPVSLCPLFLVPVLCAFGVTPYLTLKSGSAVVATGLTLAGSALLARVGTVVFQEWPRDNQISWSLYVYVLASHAAYAAVGYWLGYTTFLRWEANGTSAWREAGVARDPTLDKFIIWNSGPAHPLGSLVRKEFSLQKLSLLLGGVLCVLGAGTVFLSWVHPEYSTGALKNIVFLYCLFLPILTGTVTVAEERGLGLLEWHLTLPVPVWKQWAVKLAVAWGISLLLGFFLPWGLALLHARVDPETGGRWFHVANYLHLCLLGTSVAIYASSVSKNVLRAVALSCGIFFPALFAGDWLHGFLARHRIDSEVILGGPYHDLFHPYALVAGGCGLIALILWLALSSFRYSEDGRRSSRILQTTAVCVTVSLLLLTRFALLTVL
jgi:ABC-type transport system involved in multi-copper enzyme maturation permease subunit